MAKDWQMAFADLLVKTSTPHTLMRYTVGTYDENGRYSRPDPTESTIQAHVQPLNGIEKQEIPEGRRNQDSIKIYTDEKLKGVDSENKIQPDRILYPVLWEADTQYVAGDQVTNDTGPIKQYICTTSGTSATSGGPTGVETSITDGTCVWDYVSKGKMYEVYSSKVRHEHYKSLAIRIER